jgi:predicted TIM-barrel fold metal-dependent hydrolase
VTDRLLVVSADAHGTPPPAAVAEYLDSEFRPWLQQYQAETEEREPKLAFLRPTQEQLDLIDKEHLFERGAHLGWDIDSRLEQMDREGVAAEILLDSTTAATPPFFHAGNNVYPPEVRLAGTRMYHRWAADLIASSGGRIFGTAHPGPCLDMDQTTKDLRWLAQNGFRSVYVPGILADPALPALVDEYYEPFWMTCAELGLVLMVHAGHGRPQGELLPFVDRLRAFAGDGATPERLQSVWKAGLIPDSPFAPSTVPQQVLWQLMVGGVFDRYPNLTLAFTEVRADWVPATLAFLDACFESGDTPLAQPPSRYWESNCMAGVSSIKRSEVRLRHQIGVHKLMFGRDYPHSEGTWPNTVDWLRDALRGVPEAEARLILGENAVRCYSLDGLALARIAERIGPRPGDILEGGPSVDPALIENFEWRAGYERTFENVDTAKLEEDLFSATGLPGPR